MNLTKQKPPLLVRNKLTACSIITISLLATSCTDGLIPIRITLFEKNKNNHNKELFTPPKLTDPDEAYFGGENLPAMEKPAEIVEELGSCTPGPNDVIVPAYSKFLKTESNNLLDAQTTDNYINGAYHIIYTGTISNNKLVAPNSNDNNFILVPYEFDPPHWNGGISLSTGNDTIFFEHTGHIVQEAGNNFISASGGTKKIILNSFNLKLDREMWTDANFEFYLSATSNSSELRINTTKDKFILTDGMTFDDLIFRDVGSIIYIILKPKNEKQKEKKILTIRKEEMVDEDDLGRVYRVEELNNPALFSTGRILNENFGIYCGNTKFKKNDTIRDFSYPLIDLHYIKDYFVPKEYNSIQNLANNMNAISNNGTNSAAVNADNFFNKLIRTEFFVNNFNIPELPPISIEIQDNYLPLYLSSPTEANDNYIEIQINARTQADRLVSLEVDERMTTKKHDSFIGCTISLDVKNFYFKSHKYELCDLNVTRDFEANNIYLNMNGKRYGNIDIGSRYIYSHIYVSRQGTKSIIDVHIPNRSKIYLGDNIKFSDLTFIDNDTEEIETIDIKIKDDLNNDVTILRFRKKTEVEGGDLGYWNDPIHFQESPTIITTPLYFVLNKETFSS